MSADANETRTTPHSLVTEEHVIKLLELDQTRDAQLISWKLVDLTKHGDGFSSTVTSIQVKYSMNGQESEASYVAKISPCKGPDDFKLETNVMFTKEAKFYSELLPQLNRILEGIGEPPLNLPRCFFSCLEMGRELIYLEDLRQRGFRMCDKRTGLDVTQTTLVLKELARLHAASLLLQAENPEPLEIKHGYLLKERISLTESSRDINLTMCNGNLSSTIQILEEIGGYERAVNWVDSLRPQLEDLLTDGMRTTGYDVICHGDCWNNNILFRYNSENDPVEVMLLDLQLCRMASLAADLNYYLYTSVTGDVRRPNLTRFLSSYHSTLGKVLNAAGSPMPFSEEEITREFRSKNRLGGFYGMFSMAVKLSDPADFPESAADDDSLFQNLMEVMRTKAVQRLHGNPAMKANFLSLFDEFMETGLIQ